MKADAVKPRCNDVTVQRFNKFVVSNTTKRSVRGLTDILPENATLSPIGRRGSAFALKLRRDRLKNVKPSLLRSGGTLKTYVAACKEFRNEKVWLSALFAFSAVKLARFTTGILEGNLI